MNEVENTVLSLNDNKFHISTYLNKTLKFISNLVFPLLTTILKLSLVTGCYPK